MAAPEDVAQDLEAPRIARAVEALLADNERQGYVTDDQIVRAVFKRKIGAEGHIQVRHALSHAGIVIEGSALDSEATAEFTEETEAGVVDDSIRRYLVEIGKYKLLKPGDEVVLGRRIQAGLQATEALQRPDLLEHERSELRQLQKVGREAEEQMVSANLRLVVSVAKKYSRTFSLDLLDLIQEGTLGLMRAVGRFDYRRGYKFSTFATWWILQGVTRSIADKDRLIRLPVHIVDSLRKLRKLRRRLMASRCGSEPDARELAIHLEWDVEKVYLLLSVAEDVTSLDAPVSESDGSTLGDMLRNPGIPGPEQIFLSEEERQRIDEIVGELGGTLAEVIRLRFGLGGKDGMTLQEIGDLRGVSRERVRQIESRALDRLRKKFAAYPARADHRTQDKGQSRVAGPGQSPDRLGQTEEPFRELLAAGPATLAGAPTHEVKGGAEGASA